MQYNKEKYEKLIRGSPLFELRKNRNSAAYQRESLKMIEYLYCYLLAINERKYEPFGSEIVEVATRCINNFDPTNGIFLNYFAAAWKKEYAHIVGDRIVDEKFHGMRLAEEDKRSICKYIKLAGKLSYLSDRELFERLSEAMDIPIEKVVYFAQMSESVICGSATARDDGEEFNTIEQIADDAYLETIFEDAESVGEIMTKIDIVFDGLQDRQKSIISDLLTVKLCSIIQEISLSVTQYHFVNQDLLHEFSLCGALPSQRQIAEKYGRDEASVSRTIQTFLNKLKSTIHKE